MNTVDFIKMEIARRNKSFERIGSKLSLEVDFATSLVISAPYPEITNGAIGIKEDKNTQVAATSKE